MFAWVGSGFLGDFFLGEEALVWSEVEDHNMNHDGLKKSRWSESWPLRIEK